MKAYGRIKCILMTRAIITLGIRYRLSGKPSVLAILTHGKIPWYPLNRRLGGSGCSARAWNRYQDLTARSPVTIPATSSRVVACTYFRIITCKDWKKLRKLSLNDRSQGWKFEIRELPEEEARMPTTTLQYLVALYVTHYEAHNWQHLYYKKQ